MNKEFSRETRFSSNSLFCYFVILYPQIARQKEQQRNDKKRILIKIFRIFFFVLFVCDCAKTVEHGGTRCGLLRQGQGRVAGQCFVVNVCAQ